jgi:hypothetical protein
MGCGGGGAVLASSFYISLSLFIIVRAFSGLSQALLIAQPAQQRKGKEKKKRGQQKYMAEERAFARAKRFVLVVFLSNPQIWVLPPSQTLACWHPKLIEKKKLQ